MRRFASFALACVLALSLPSCASQECDFHSQCGMRFHCESGRCAQDCREDFDCAAGQICDVLGRCVAETSDAGTRDAGTRDAGTSDAGRDAGVIADAGHDAGGAPDAGRDGGADAGRDAGTDAGLPGRYLDRCVAPADCESGRCVDDVGDTRFCTIACSTHTQCASEHVCAEGQCVPNDTGKTCSSGTQCALGLCAGNPATGAGECTRTCANAADCPGGYACADAGGVFVCVNIERPCSQCPTGLCLDDVGCTATCRSPADCPLTLPGLPYSCSSGRCVPSSGIVGPDPMGAACREVSGSNLCRGGVCIDDFGGASVCTQRCSEGGGCGHGFACYPADDGGGGVIRICQRTTGTADMGEACTGDADCHSGICHATLGFCTRFCTSDGLCPTGLTCRIDLPGVSTCRP